MFYTEKIKRPVLMAHHADDECRVTTLTGARAAYRTLAKSPRKAFITVSGGDTPRSRACGPLSAHGFLGVERETVAAIVEWMNGGDAARIREPVGRRFYCVAGRRSGSPQPQSGLTPGESVFVGRDRPLCLSGSWAPLAKAGRDNHGGLSLPSLQPNRRHPSGRITPPRPNRFHRNTEIFLGLISEGVFPENSV